MSTYLLDSDIIIDVLTKRNRRDETLLSLLGRGHLLACCSVNVTEVYAGMRPPEKERTDKLLESFAFLEVTREIAKAAGSLIREWRGKGVTLSLPDATVAAVALQHDLTLLTGNLKHYPMPALKHFAA